MKLLTGTPLRVVGVALLLASIARSALAGAPAVPCDRPLVFPGAALNVLVLPYRFTGAAGTASEALGKVGDELSALLQQDILLTLLRYGSVGTVQLVESGAAEECEPRVILAHVLGADAPGGGSPFPFGSGPEVRPGGGLILLWGRVFVRQGEVYLQSYLRFLRRGAEETVAVTVPGLDGAALQGRLSRTSFSFAPRKMEARELEALHREAADATRLYREPDGEEVVAERLEAGRPYVVTDASGSWMKIKVLAGGPEGWLRARPDASRFDLWHLIPELDLLDGISAYLRYRAGREADITSAPAGTTRNARQRLGWYTENADPEADAEAVAVAEVLRGFLDVLEATPEGAVSAVVEAAPRFERALRLVPDDADLRNLAALSRVAGLATGARREDAPAVAERLLDALALEPRNALVVGNLETLYRLLGRLGPEASPYPEEELTTRLAAVRRVRDYLRQEDDR